MGSMKCMVVWRGRKESSTRHGGDNVYTRVYARYEDEDFDINHAQSADKCSE